MIGPKVSVVMTTYNSSSYLAEAVESILNQTVSDIEFIIVDDGSTDNTWDILTQYADCNQRISLIKNEENLGTAKSSNKGLSLATGEYIARFDSDDISLPNRLQEQIRYMEENPSVDLLTTSVEYIDTTGSHIGYYSPPLDPVLLAWKHIFSSPLRHPTAFWRREQVESFVGNYNPEFRYALDYEFFARTSRALKVEMLPIVLVKMRQNPKSISFSKGNLQDDFAAKVTYQQFNHYLQQSPLDEQEKADLRALLRRHSPLQSDQFKALDQARMSRALNNYLMLVSEFYSSHSKGEEPTNFGAFFENIESEIPNLMHYCSSKNWNSLPPKFTRKYLSKNPSRTVPLTAKLFLYFTYYKLGEITFIKGKINKFRTFIQKSDQHKIAKSNGNI
ncbi:glycosyltransferase family 2 protein [Nodosilinea sp. E11]|uniref:glycosyltransferase family 2 protein n=1 Tax=Nodosilinea sp. E11 TaxID=3037479 RepID=UPI00293410C9|nr:glycosyltransferase [Nodosilinea sp. E11]WOD39269.1 glycosyltransferase [Nodosilinea sp. E11]